VIFFENRSFDHIFGCSKLPGIDGIKPGMGNWRDPNDHSKGFVEVKCGSAEYVCSHDEDHSFTGTTIQLFGPGVTTGAHAPYPNVTMGGYANHSLTSMEAFAPEQLPVKMALAREFGLFNNFYAAMPGPSQPNHMFAQSATSCGATETGVIYEQCGGVLPLFPQKTIYESLLEAGLDFKVYYNGSVQEGGVPGDIYMSGLLENLGGRAKTFDAPGGFFDAAASGTLPAFSWLAPRNGGSHPNDDHPCHDVALGEELLKSVYEALRAGPAWNETALFVVYDDPGGWFDHVPPGGHPEQVHAPPPEAPCEQHTQGCPDKFAFDRLGARLANLLISPRVPKGSVFRDPRGPTNTSKFDLASIPATVKNLFGLPDFLTKRDAWSGSFHELLKAEPRADTPMHLPDAPPPSHDVPQRHGCGSPEEATRRQKRHDELLDTVVDYLGGQGLVGDDDDDRTGGENAGAGDNDDDDDASIPLLGENSFLVTKPKALDVPGYEELTLSIARKVQAVLDTLDEEASRRKL